MKHAASQALYSYWNELRGHRSSPERSDLDPVAMRGVLADTILIDVDVDHRSGRLDLAIRLAGTRVSALFGSDLAGRDLLGLWRGEDHNAMSRFCATVLDDSVPAVAGILGSPPEDPPIGLELLLLPLRHSGKTHARLLGLLAPAEMPSWLGLRTIESLRLVTQRFIRQDGRAFPEPATMTALSRGLQRHAPATRHGHLTVHEGGQSELMRRNAFAK